MGSKVAAISAAIGRWKIHAGIAVAVVCNLVLLSAWLWSRGGQTTALRIDVRGDEFAAYIDGRERVRAMMPSPDAGGITVYAVNPSIEPASLGGRGDIERVEVRDLATGEVLLEREAITDPPRPDEPDQEVALVTIAEPWEDYSVEITYRRLIESRVDVRVAGDDFVTVGIDRFFSGSVVMASTMEPAPGEVAATGAPLELSKRGSIKGAVAIVLQGYPVAITLAVLFAAGAAAAMRWLTVTELTWWPPRPRFALPIAVVAGCVVAGVVAYLLRFRVDALAYVADEAAYIYQSRLFASGRIYASTPAVPDAFSFSSTPFIIDYDGRWAPFYPFGHALALTSGTLMGATWVVPPILAGMNVVLLYLAGRFLYGAWTGLAAAVLLAVSPFALMQGASYMSHTTAVTYLLVCLCAIGWTLRRPQDVAARVVTGAFVGAMGGVAFGLLFNTRPLTSVLVAPALAMLLLLGMRRSSLRHSAPFVVAFGLGAILLFAMYLGYNWRLTGDPFESGYAGSGDLQAVVGFGGENSVAIGLNNEVSGLAALALVLNGWPAWLGFALVLMPFVTGTRNAVDWVLLLGGLLVIAGGAAYIATGFFYGPRYVFESLPFLLLLSARGLVRLAETPLTVGQFSRPGGQRTRAVTGWCSLVVASIAAGLVCASLAGWLFSSTTRQEVYATPPSADALRTGIALDTRLVAEARRQQLGNALVVITPCDAFRRCYLNPFLENNVARDGSIVWVYDSGGIERAQLLEDFPCRSIYEADYAKGTLTRVGATASGPGVTCD